MFDCSGVNSIPEICLAVGKSPYLACQHQDPQPILCSFSFLISCPHLLHTISHSIIGYFSYQVSRLLLSSLRPVTNHLDRQLTTKMDPRGLGKDRHTSNGQNIFKCVSFSNTVRLLADDHSSLDSLDKPRSSITSLLVKRTLI